MKKSFLILVGATFALGACTTLGGDAAPIPATQVAVVPPVVPPVVTPPVVTPPVVTPPVVTPPAKPKPNPPATPPKTIDEFPGTTTSNPGVSDVSDGRGRAGEEANNRNTGDRASRGRAASTGRPDRGRGRGRV